MLRAVLVLLQAVQVTTLRRRAAEFLRVDKGAVLAFAVACTQAGVAHFELLGSVGADSASSRHYQSIFQPSMILTPTKPPWPKRNTALGGVHGLDHHLSINTGPRFRYQVSS